MSDAGWFNDPSGRFATRWYDGASWSEHVVGANGSVTADTLPDRDTPYPPPSPARSGPTPPPQPIPPGYPPTYPPSYPPSYAPAGFGPPGPRPRYRPGPGLVIAAIGLVALAVSLFGPNWIRSGSGDSSFLKLASNAQDATLPDGVDADVAIAYAFFAWAGFVLFGLSVVFVVAGLVPVPPTSHAAMRITGSVVAGIGSVMHAATFGQIASDDRAFADYLGFGAWYVVILGFVVGVRQVGAVRLTGQRAGVAT